jgi:hypothetical protein
MKSPHLLRVTDPPEGFAPLIEAARALGLRIGWLDLGAAVSPLPGPLESAAALGVLRAVAVGEGRTVAIKPLRGATVLKDLLREHFRGCALVLVRGEVDAPRLEREGEGWALSLADGAVRRPSSVELAESLRRPHPFS